MDNHEVQLFLPSTLQQPMKTCHQLVRLGPDTVTSIPYTTLKASYCLHPTIKIVLLQLKYSHL